MYFVNNSEFVIQEENFLYYNEKDNNTTIPWTNDVNEKTK